MKKFLYIVPIIFLSCSENSDNITISKSDYKKLIGDTIKPKYPKVIKVDVNNALKNSIEVYLGSDGHEYSQTNRDYLIHYGGCELCEKKYDTLLFYIKNKK